MKPLLQSISDPEQARKWTAFHAVLGVLSAFTPWGFILFFYTIILFNFFGSIKILKRGNILPFTLLMGYLQSYYPMVCAPDGVPQPSSSDPSGEHLLDKCSLQRWRAQHARWRDARPTQGGVCLISPRHTSVLPVHRRYQ